MLKITIPASEVWDEKTGRFSLEKECTIKLEHSLISISEWEAKWCVPFFTSEKTNDQLIDYIRCMTISKDVNPDVLLRLTSNNIKEINDYIAAPMTATTIGSDKKGRPSKEIITSEVIYYWMITYNIPVEFEKWHINRLIMLIRVCSEFNKPKKKRSRSDIIAENRALNAARKARLGTKG